MGTERVPGRMGVSCWGHCGGCKPAAVPPCAGTLAVRGDGTQPRGLALSSSGKGDEGLETWEAGEDWGQWGGDGNDGCHVVDVGSAAARPTAAR